MNKKKIVKEIIKVDFKGCDSKIKAIIIEKCPNHSYLKEVKIPELCKVFFVKNSNGTTLATIQRVGKYVGIFIRNVKEGE